MRIKVVTLVSGLTPLYLAFTLLRGTIAVSTIA